MLQIAIIKISYGLVSAVFCFISALFAFWAFAFKSKKMVICDSLEKFIYLIDREPWLSLPENSIKVSFTIWDMFLLKFTTVRLNLSDIRQGADFNRDFNH